MGTPAASAHTVPRLSAVIPTRNRGRALGRVLSSLRDQTLDPSQYEVVVVDDGSDPPVRCPGWAGDPRLRVVRLAHVERSAARNEGAREAHGEILVFLDDDMLPDRTLLEAHARAQAEWPGALVVGEIALAAESLRTPFGRFRSDLERSATPRSRGPVSRPNFASAANMSISRRGFLALGGFDAGIVSSEDQDLALRHSAAGGTIVYAPEAAAVHDDSATSLREYCRRAEWGAELMEPFCRRYPAWPDNQLRRSVNGPVSWSRDPPGLISRKIAKQLLGRPPALGLLHALIGRLEARMPSSGLLASLYRLALGIHIQRGFRKGWRVSGRAARKASEAP